MRDQVEIGLGLFGGMVALALILRREVRRAPVQPVSRLEARVPESTVSIAELRAQEIRQKPKEGRN